MDRAVRMHKNTTIQLSSQQAQKNTGKMRINSVLIAIVAAAIITMTHCKLHPHSIPEELMKRLDLKRQAESEVDQCIEDTLGKNLVDSECDRRLVESVLGDVSDLREDEDEVDFNTAYGLFCLPQCRVPIVSALDVCGFFNGTEFLRDYIVDMCQINENGKPCYTLFEKATEFINETESSCYSSALKTKECDCRPELQSALREQGCCINIHHAAFQGFYEKLVEMHPYFVFFQYRPQDLYNMYCNISLPGECNDISGSLALQYTISIIIAAVGLAIFG